jgi:Protein of unknown function (DUF993)
VGLSITLPRADGSTTRYDLVGAAPPSPPATPITGRVAYAAAHVVADPWADNTPGAPAVLDWDGTLGIRHHLWRHGLRVAEAMDTAQRGMGLDWATTQELIRRSGAEARAVGGALACGAGTDQLGPQPATLDEIQAAYEEQVETVQAAGATVILMASRHLARAARGPEDYAAVYSALLKQASEPVILHWLGAAFDPVLAGYWGHQDPAAAASVVLDVIAEHRDRIDGIKVSLLDPEHERRLRARLPEGVRLYTGDDFNYPELIRGDGAAHSDAMLGIFDGIAPAAAAALAALDAGDPDRYDRLLGPTVPLSRHLFAAPTYYYKTGLTFLAWLNGLQSHFRMVGGLESARSLSHLAEVLVLADRAGVLTDPAGAVRRTRTLLEVGGLTS